MTRNAFGRPALAQDFNYEADVIIWDSANSVVDKYFKQSFSDAFESDIKTTSEISLIYRPEDNNGISELQRLNEIQDSLAEYIGEMRVLE